MFAFLLLFALVPISFADDPKRIVCAYSSWAIYRPSIGALSPENIDATSCSHLIYTYAGITPEAEIKILDQNSDVDLGGFRKFAALKGQMSDGKVLISIGGHNDESDSLSGIAASTWSRRQFAKSCVEFFKSWNFDGVDIAWQYPQKADKQNLVELLQELRRNFNEDYVLSVTLPRDTTDGYNSSAISNIVDFVNIMTFDYHTPLSEEQVTGHNAPLYDTSLSIDNTITNWIDAGIESEKINLGIPSYGHSYSLDSASKHNVGDKAYLGISGPYTQIRGTLAYYEICSIYINDTWEENYDSNHQVPYKFSEFNWISYDDETSVVEKTRYIKTNNLGGAFIWTLDTDDFMYNCELSILDTVFREFYYTQRPYSNKVY